MADFVCQGLLAVFGPIDPGGDPGADSRNTVRAADGAAGQPTVQEGPAPGRIAVHHVQVAPGGLHGEQFAQFSGAFIDFIFDICHLAWIESKLEWNRITQLGIVWCVCRFICHA